MADKESKWEDNVGGKFYVDEECILCSVCSDAAPENFRMSDDEDQNNTESLGVDTQEFVDLEDDDDDGLGSVITANTVSTSFKNILKYVWTDLLQHC